MIGVSAGSVGLAQVRPSFAGSWESAPIVTPPVPMTAKPGSSGRGASQVKIVQDRSRLTVVGHDMSETYALDGSETTNFVKLNGVMVPEQCRVRWNGDELIVIGTFEMRNGERRVITKKLSLDASGALTIDITHEGKSPGFHTRTTYGRRSTILS
ncbi:MAG: hypothetical protein NVS1B4_10450 [Gemmatimonadaceae bacterium]